MKLIDKIIAYCRKVEKAERPKQSDKEEYSHGKYAVASSVLKLVELNQPEPPTLRPMSELPEVFYEVVLVIEERKERYNMIVRKHEGYLVGENNIVFNSAKNFQSKDTNISVSGWLHELPNPNKIKLP
jgi:hypothetical protein